MNPGPNRSVEATRNGMAPRCAVVHSEPRGAMPLRAPHLQRYTAQVYNTRIRPV